MQSNALVALIGLLVSSGAGAQAQPSAQQSTSTTTQQTPTQTQTTTTRSTTTAVPGTTSVPAQTQTTTTRSTATTPTDSATGAPAGPTQSSSTTATTTTTNPSAPTAATAADVKTGVSVYDQNGGVVGKVESVNAKGAVVSTGSARATIPVSSFAKNDKGLIISMTKAELDASAKKKTSAKPK